MAGAAWAFVGKIIGVGSALIVNAILARMLTAEEMGAYFLTASIAMFAAILGSFGLRQTVVRLIAESLVRQQAGRARDTVRIVFLIAATGALLVGSAYYLFAGAWLARDVFQMPVLIVAGGLTALWIAILTFQTPLSEIFRGLHDIRLAVFLDGILTNALLAIVVAFFLFIGFKLDYTGAVLVTMLAAAVSLFFGLLQLWRRRSVFRGEGVIGAGEVIRISVPLFIANLGNYSINQFSLWIVGANLEANDVALYGAAWRLVNLLAMPLMLMNMTVNPVIAELHTTRANRSLQNALRGTATLAALPAFLVLVVYMGFSADVLELVYGTTYRSGSTVLLILSIGMLANVWTGSCSQVLAMTGHQRHLMTITAVTGVASVIVAIFAVQVWGLIGVAAAVALGRVVQNLVGWLMVYRLTGLWTHGTLSPAFIQAAMKRVLTK